jgi:ferredoxin, 2Fe-2S
MRLEHAKAPRFVSADNCDCFAGDMHRRRTLIMPRITLRPSGRVLHAADGENLFRAIRRHDQPLASSCDGDGVCEKCRITILEGMDHLTSPNDVEESFRRERQYGAAERLACQTWVFGDVTVTTGYW